MYRYEMNYERESGFIEDVGRMTKIDYYYQSDTVLTNTKKKDRKSPTHDDDDDDAANVDDDALRHFFPFPFLSFPLSRRLA